MKTLDMMKEVMIKQATKRNAIAQKKIVDGVKLGRKVSCGKEGMTGRTGGFNNEGGLQVEKKLAKKSNREACCKSIRKQAE